MREHSLDEFESIFERASIPVLDVETVALTRLSVVLGGDEMDASTLGVARYLHERFGAAIRLHVSKARKAESLSAIRAVAGQEGDAQPFASSAELVGQVSIDRSQLLLLGEPEDEAARAVDLDSIVQGTRPPVLVLRRATGDAAAVFSRILHGLSGNFRQTQNFAYSFTLAETTGRVMLYHVIREEELVDVRDALRVSPDIAHESGEHLLERLAGHGERYLKAVVAAARQRPFDVGYRLSVGEIVASVRAEVKAGGYSLLVVGTHEDGHSHISADDYRLMHEIAEVPVLAL